MGIDFCKKDKLEMRRLFEMTHKLYDELQPVFDEFERTTGIFVDPYGKVPLYPGNIKLIRDITLSRYSKAELLHNKDVGGFLSFLENICKEDILVHVIGD